MMHVGFSNNMWTGVTLIYEYLPKMKTGSGGKYPKMTSFVNIPLPDTLVVIRLLNITWNAEV